MDPIFCHLNAVSGAFGAEMKQLLDVALTVEQHQPDGSLQWQMHSKPVPEPLRRWRLLPLVVSI